MVGLGLCWAQLVAVSPQTALPAPEEPFASLNPPLASAPYCCCA